MLSIRFRSIWVFSRKTPRLSWKNASYLPHIELCVPWRNQRKVIYSILEVSWDKEELCKNSILKDHVLIAGYISNMIDIDFFICQKHTMIRPIADIRRFDIMCE